jgi:hypothetical protein
VDAQCLVEFSGKGRRQLAYALADALDGDGANLFGLRL